MRHKVKQGRECRSTNALLKEENRGPRKHITFSRGGNTVRLVKPPPRSLNHQYWFTKTASIVKKGVFFEIEPSVSVSVEVDCRMQLTSLGSSPGHMTGGGGAARGKGPTRTFLEIKAHPPDVLGPAVATTPWLTVASVTEGEIVKTRVVMPAGTYVLRCVGSMPLKVFAQAWDLEEKMS